MRCSRRQRAGSPSVAVTLTGSPAIWSAFNTANKSAMMKSELLSWPVTMAIIVLAFGSLVAAGLPLLLTILGLVSSAGLLALLTGAFDISIWAMQRRPAGLVAESAAAGYRICDMDGHRRRRHGDPRDDPV